MSGGKRGARISFVEHDLKCSCGCGAFYIEESELDESVMIVCSHCYAGVRARLEVKE